MGEFVKRFFSFYSLSLVMTAVLSASFYFVSIYFDLNYSYPKNTVWLNHPSSIFLAAFAVALFTASWIAPKFRYITLAVGICVLFQFQIPYSDRISIGYGFNFGFYFWIFGIFGIVTLVLALTADRKTSNQGKFFDASNKRIFLFSLISTLILAVIESFLFGAHGFTTSWTSIFWGLIALVAFPLTIVLTTSAFWLFTSADASGRWSRTKNALGLLLIIIAVLTVKNPIANSLWVIDLFVVSAAYSWRQRSKSKTPAPEVA